MARRLPPMAAFSVQDRAAAISRGTPSPRSYSLARRYSAMTRPRPAASLRSWTPRVFSPVCSSSQRVVVEGDRIAIADGLVERDARGGGSGSSSGGFAGGGRSSSGHGGRGGRGGFENVGRRIDGGMVGRVLGEQHGFGGAGCGGGGFGSRRIETGEIITLCVLLAAHHGEGGAAGDRKRSARRRRSTDPCRCPSCRQSRRW